MQGYQDTKNTSQPVKQVKQMARADNRELFELIDKCSQILRDDKILLRTILRDGNQELHALLKEYKKNSSLEILQSSLRKFLKDYKKSEQYTNSGGVLRLKTSNDNYSPYSNREQKVIKYNQNGKQEYSPKQIAGNNQKIKLYSPQIRNYLMHTQYYSTLNYATKNGSPLSHQYQRQNLNSPTHEKQGKRAISRSLSPNIINNTVSYESEIYKVYQKMVQKNKELSNNLKQANQISTNEFLTISFGSKNVSPSEYKNLPTQLPLSEDIPSGTAKYNPNTNFSTEPISETIAHTNPNQIAINLNNSNDNQFALDELDMKKLLSHFNNQEQDLLQQSSVSENNLQQQQQSQSSRQQLQYVQVMLQQNQIPQVSQQSPNHNKQQKGVEQAKVSPTHQSQQNQQQKQQQQQIQQQQLPQLQQLQLWQQQQLHQQIQLQEQQFQQQQQKQLQQQQQMQQQVQGIPEQMRPEEFVQQQQNINLMSTPVQQSHGENQMSDHLNKSGNSKSINIVNISIEGTKQTSDSKKTKNKQGSPNRPESIPQHMIDLKQYQSPSNKSDQKNRQDNQLPGSKDFQSPKNLRQAQNEKIQVTVQLNSSITSNNKGQQQQGGISVQNVNLASQVNPEVEKKSSPAQQTNENSKKQEKIPVSYPLNINRILDNYSKLQANICLVTKQQIDQKLLQSYQTIDCFYKQLEKFSVEEILCHMLNGLTLSLKNITKDYFTYKISLLIPQMSRGVYEQFFNIYDKDKDNLLNISELVKALQQFCKKENSISVNIKTLFQKIDTKKQNKITIFDLQQYIKKLNLQKIQEQQIDNLCTKIFREIDFMHSGFISYWDLFLEQNRKIVQELLQMAQ